MKATQEALVDQVIRAYSHVSLNNHRIFERFKVVLSALEEAGIPCMPLKGADLLFRLYGVMGSRPMYDVDLLIRPGNLERTDQILRTLGFSQVQDGNPSYHDRDNVLALDIVTDLWYLENTEALWERSQIKKVLGSTMNFMAAEDLFLYLSAYNVIHRGFLTAAFEKDLLLLLEHETLDWDEILQKSQRCRLKPALLLIYEKNPLLRHRWPSRFASQLKPQTLSELLIFLFLKTFVTKKELPGLGHLLLWLTAPRRSQLRWLQAKFFPSNFFLRYRYPKEYQYPKFLILSKRFFYLLYRSLKLSLFLILRFFQLK